MPLTLTSPFDTDLETEPDAVSHGKSVREHAQNLCFILIKAGGFLGSTYLMTLGFPLLVLLLLTGGNIEVLLGHLANLADHFTAADSERRMSFTAGIKLGLMALATVVGILRLPRFLDEISLGLREQAQ